MIKTVKLTRAAEKGLEKAPPQVQKKFTVWVTAVELIGLDETKKAKGFHDEPLKGARQGQRSIRLNKAYRAIYEIKGDEIEFVEVQEVNKHDYS